MPGAPQYPSVHPSIHPSIHLSISLSLYRTPQIGGVGGTRALAHSIYIYTHTYKDTFPKIQKKCLPITVPIIYNSFFMAFHPGAPGTCTKRCPALPPWDPACPALARRSSIWFRTPAGMPQKFSWESLYSWVMIYKQAA